MRSDMGKMDARSQEMELFWGIKWGVGVHKGRKKDYKQQGKLYTPS